MRRWRRDEDDAMSGARRIPMTVTFLEMTAKPAALPPPAPRGRYAILRAEKPPPHFYRYLYDTIGDRYFWVDRRKIDDSKLCEIIHAPTNFLYVLYTDGNPAGMAEMDLKGDGTANIAYFGLMPEAQGKHLSFFFLYHSCMNAWVHPISRLTVNTCTLDSPRALPLYQRMGFTPYAREERFVELLEGQNPPG
jgi:GNAT superfamily N-acetyltransferase